MDGIPARIITAKAKIKGIEIHHSAVIALKLPWAYIIDVAARAGDPNADATAKAYLDSIKILK